jgi:hypothetical protein
MHRRRILAGLALAFVCALAPSCGGGGGAGASKTTTTTVTRLSPSAYRTRLAALGQTANGVYAHAEKALRAKSVAEIENDLRAFANGQDRLGDQVGALNPPANAQAANAELARGEHDTATETRALLPKLANFRRPKAALAFLNKQLSTNAKGGRETDEAIAKLKKLGYTKGS